MATANRQQEGRGLFIQYPYFVNCLPFASKKRNKMLVRIMEKFENAWRSLDENLPYDALFQMSLQQKGIVQARIVGGFSGIELSQSVRLIVSKLTIDEIAQVSEFRSKIMHSPSPSPPEGDDGDEKSDIAEFRKANVLDSSCNAIDMLPQNPDHLDDVVKLLALLMNLPRVCDAYVYSFHDDKCVKVQDNLNLDPSRTTTVVEANPKKQGKILHNCCHWCEASILSKYVSISYCTKCLSVGYCSKFCQTKDWTLYHKKECKQFRKGKVQTSPNRRVTIFQDSDATGVMGGIVYLLFQKSDGVYDPYVIVQHDCGVFIIQTKQVIAQAQASGQ